LTTKLKEYFNKNWQKCEAKWVKFHRLGLPTYLSETNNPVEIINKQLKSFCNKKYPIDKALLEMLSYINYSYSSQRSINFYERTKKVSCQSTGSLVTDKIFNSFYKSCTPTVASWLIEQYNLTLNKVYTLGEENGKEIKVLFQDKSYTINNYDLDMCKCSCYQSQSMQLPCRHIFFVRNIKSLEVFSHNMVPKR
jgi:hypothetical protein